MNQTQPINQQQIMWDLNVVTTKTNEDSMKIIEKVHRNLFNLQNDQITIGLLHHLDKSIHDQQLSQILQQMEYKKQCFIEIEQVLLILTYEPVKYQQGEPITFVTSARNLQNNTDRVTINKPKDHKVSIDLDLTKTKEKFLETITFELGIDPFQIKPIIDDYDLNKIYYISLSDAPLRQCYALMIVINRLDNTMMNEDRVAKRILKVISSLETKTKQ